MANHIWNEDTESEEDDDWFYNSVRKYDQLCMYKLLFSANCLDVSKDKILLSGKNVSSRNVNELSIFRIPAKLTSSDDEGMTKDRDFSLVAGVNDEKSGFIQATFFGDGVLSLQSDGQFSVWKIKPSSDLLIKVATVQMSDYEAFQILDLSTFAIFSREKLSKISLEQKFGGLEFKVDEKQFDPRILRVLAFDENVLVSVDEIGTIRLHKTSRFDEVLAISESPASDVNTLIRSRLAVAGKKIYQLFEDFQLQIHEVTSSSRNDPISIRTLVNPEVRKPNFVQDDIVKFEWTKTKFQEGSPNILAVVGKKVFICELNETGKDSFEILELFCHDGHKSDVLDSGPHPEIENLFLSSDVKNNLHAWSFKNKNT